MPSEPVNAYFEEKAKLLTQCIKISEEVLGSLESEEDLHTLILRRENVILQLKTLEEACDQGTKNSCSKPQKEQIDQLVSLLLAMDKDASDSISTRQKKLLEDIKENKKRQQIANYTKP